MGPPPAQASVQTRPPMSVQALIAKGFADFVGKAVEGDKSVVFDGEHHFGVIFDEFVPLGA